MDPVGLESALAADVSASTSLGSPGSAAAPGFTLRRVPNPRYQSPAALEPVLPIGQVSRLEAIDHARAHILRRGTGASAYSEWALGMGEQGHDHNGVELTLAGISQSGAGRIQNMRLDAHRWPLSAALGDAAPLQFGPLASLQRLRGGYLMTQGRNGAQLRVVGGVPSPVSGGVTPRLGFGGVTASDVPVDAARLSFGVLGFGRARTIGLPGPGLEADTLAGRGGAFSFGWRVPVPYGSLASALGAQVHTLDGPQAVAVQHMFEWSVQARGLTLLARDEHASARAMQIGTERITAAPGVADYLSLRQRFARGRAEGHVTAAMRQGGDPTLATRSWQGGISGNLGASAWYGGTDAAWDWRAVTGSGELRLSVNAGRFTARGDGYTIRAERTSDPGGRAALALSAECGVGLTRGRRLEIEPRLGWDAQQFQRALTNARLGWPLPWGAGRLDAGLAVGAERDQGFRVRVSEASLALTWQPRARDRGGLEVRQTSGSGLAVTEYSADYETWAERYEAVDTGLLGTRDSGRVRVRVVRTGNSSGVGEVLVSLDGKDLRFTDEDGYARFDRVPRGVHVIAIEERSLPEGMQSMDPPRTFVTVDGTALEPVIFRVGRPERLYKF